MEAGLLNPGQRLDEWVVGTVVDETKDGVVYDASRDGADPEPSLAWVVEVNPEELDAVHQRVLQLKDVLARVENSGLSAVRGAGQVEGRVYLVTSGLQAAEASSEDVAGLEDPSMWVEALLVAVSRIHEKRCPHGAIRASNVRLASPGQPCLVGYRLRVNVHPGELDEIPSWDTARYLAPELLENELGNSMAADVYALGVVMWEHLVGRAAFDALDAEQPLGEALRAKAKHPSLDPGPDFDSHVRRLLRAMTHPGPAERLTSAVEALEVLRVDSVGFPDLMETFRTPMPAYQRDFSELDAEAYKGGAPTPILPPPRPLEPPLPRPPLTQDKVPVSDLVGGILVGVLVGLMTLFVTFMAYVVLWVG